MQAAQSWFQPFIKISIRILVVILVTGTALHGQVKKPNIIIILADDLGYGDLGCFGSQIIKTPHLDLLASQGLRLARMYSGSTVCAPSRCALLTGRHTGQAYIRGNGEIPLRPEDKIIPEYLKAAGYTTGLFGKWGLGDINTSGSPEKKGWDFFTGHLHHIEGHYQFPAMTWRLNAKTRKPERVPLHEFEGCASDFFCAEAIRFIQNQSTGNPFFLFLSIPMPHAELKTTAQNMKRYQDENGKSLFTEKSFPGKHYGGQEQPRAAYAAMVSQLDQYVGQIQSILKEKKILDNTLILFSSDNGTHIEGGRTKEDVAWMNSSGGWRGVKRDLYEGGIRVPTIVSGMNIPKGQVDSTAYAFWDLLPTLLHFAGIPRPSSLNGVSLKDSWTLGKKLIDRPLYWEFYENGYKQAISLGSWKYIFSIQAQQNSSEELYDLSTDPQENTNTIHLFPAKAKELKAIAARMYTPSIHPAFKRPLE
jgi:arylsulfatase A-like enzyme